MAVWSLVSVVCYQEELYDGQSLVQRSPIVCGVSNQVRSQEISTKRRPRRNRAVEPQKRLKKTGSIEGSFILFLSTTVLRTANISSGVN